MSRAIPVMLLRLRNRRGEVEVRYWVFFSSLVTIILLLLLVDYGLDQPFQALQWDYFKYQCQKFNK